MTGDVCFRYRDDHTMKNSRKDSTSFFCFAKPRMEERRALRYSSGINAKPIYFTFGGDLIGSYLNARFSTTVPIPTSSHQLPVYLYIRRLVAYYSHQVGSQTGEIGTAFLYTIRLVPGNRFRDIVWCSLEHSYIGLSRPSTLL